MTTKIEKVTPVIAKKWLEKNYEDNRPINKRWVAYLARQMSNNLWQMNGQTIVFDKNNMLLDGQHRLTAVMQSGKTVEMEVRRGVDTDAFTTIDQTYVRNAGQVLRMKDEKNAACLAAVCRRVYAWEVWGHPKCKEKLSPDEISMVLECYPELRECVSVAITTTRPIPLNTSMCAFVFFLIERTKPRKAQEFMDTLETGLGKNRKDPAVVLRDKLFKVASAQTRRRFTDAELFSLMIRAWNYYSKNEEIASLGLKHDKDGKIKIPTVYGLGREQGGKTSKTGGTKDFAKK